MTTYLILSLKKFKKEVVNKQNFILISSSYIFIIFLYHSLLEASAAPKSAFLYIAATQSIVSSFASFAFEINHDMVNQRFEILSTLPVHYPIQQIIKSTYTYLCKFCPILIILIFISNKNIFHFSLVHFLSCLLYNSIGNFIGLLSHFIRNIKQLFYLNLTLTFALGGLFAPIESNFTLLKKISEYTPYPYILSFPAKIFTQNAEISFLLILKYILWIIAVMLLTNVIYNKILKDI